MNIAKVCFICLNENKQNLISIFSCIRELHPQLNSMREQLQKTRKIENNWSRIDDLRIIEILDNCFPQQVCLHKLNINAIGLSVICIIVYLKIKYR